MRERDLRSGEVRFRNNFHNTCVVVRMKDGQELSARQVDRIWKELCGIKDCWCGGVRGPQTHNLYIGPDRAGWIRSMEEDKY